VYGIDVKNIDVLESGKLVPFFSTGNNSLKRRAKPIVNENIHTRSWKDHRLKRWVEPIVIKYDFTKSWKDDSIDLSNISLF
jgi:hypothetical protein